MKELLKDKRVIYGLIGILAVFLIAIVVVVVVFAGKKEPVVESEEPVVTEEVTEVVEVDHSHDGMEKSYLTGLWTDPTIAEKQPVALMIENTYGTLPQYGISKADIVYELSVEGGITRLMGIFQDYSGMDRIGNIRSCRLNYLYFAKEYDAVYYHCGQNYLADNLLASGFVYDVNGINGNCSGYFYRVTDEGDRTAPHNLYTSSAMIDQAISDFSYPTTITSDEVKNHFTFAEEDNLAILPSGTDAKVLELYYANNHPYFIYDDATGSYLRYEFEEPQIDALTNEQLAYENVILQNIPMSFTDEGVVLMNNVGEGTGKFFTQGKMIDISWKKESDTSATKYYDTLGNEITLNPGKTWICVQNTSDVEKNVYYTSIDDYNNK